MLLVLVNLAKEDYEAEVKLDMKKLGLKADSHAMDAVTAEKVEFADGQVSAHVPWHEYRLVIIGTRELDRIPTYAK